jgi:hypothetical protein
MSIDDYFDKMRSLYCDHYKQNFPDDLDLKKINTCLMNGKTKFTDIEKEIKKYQQGVGAVVDELALEPQCKM